jgi:putative N6-adenine-specific DNA methylase
MAEFFASTARGLVDPMEIELKEMGLKVLEKTAGGVYFESNWEGCYLANLQSRLASRILKPILDFTAYQPEELYGQIRKHDYTKYIKPNQTISIDVTVRDGMMNDQRYVAMKIKDAVVDQFREKFGVRPDVDNVNPSLRLIVRGVRNQFNIALDTSGDSLFMRGYRKEVGEAPLKENLAAGLIKLSEWDGQSSIVDMMCGSGTFLIEAAMMAKNIAPGINRKRFGFQNWLNYDEEAWDRIIDEAVNAEVEELPFKFYGYDIDSKVIRSAKENARAAGVDDAIEFRKESVATVTPPTDKGLIIVNPPYGARIGDEDNLRDVYRDLSFTLKHRFKGWDAWVLSGNKELIGDLKLKSTRKHFVFNGNIECRFLKYSMF